MLVTSATWSKANSTERLMPIRKGKQLTPFSSMAEETATGSRVRPHPEESPGSESSRQNRSAPQSRKRRPQARHHTWRLLGKTRTVLAGKLTQNHHPRQRGPRSDLATGRVRPISGPDRQLT